jgi:hypothetical protein
MAALLTDDAGAVALMGASGENVTTMVYHGALDALNIYSLAVGVYAFKRLFVQYTGPLVRLRRATDNQLADIWFDSDGLVTQYAVVGTGAPVLASAITAWSASAVVAIDTWYDQSASAKHLVQTTLSSQPNLSYDAGLGSYAADFTSNFSSGDQLYTSNVFPTATISNMQLITKVRERSRLTGHTGYGPVVVGYHGIAGSGSSGTTWLQMPDRKNDAGGESGVAPRGRWYWLGRIVSSAGIVAAGSVARVSAYVSSAQGGVGLTVNNVPYFATGATSFNVSNGLRVGGFFHNNTVGFYNGYVQYVVTLNAKVSEQTTATIQSVLG